ncbi:deoxyribonuclease-2-beta [Macrotis lagotis]|uniref:deoxyribonuclease-2-beta n=1 Tax=Macrotis lagotis TaxID=92651 RepID=UPI003D698C32
MTARLLNVGFTVLFLSFCTTLGAARISCRNEDGDAVDWFVFYKLPQNRKEKNERSGLEYMYLDPTTRSWQKSERLVNMTQSVLGRTLQQLYEAWEIKNYSTAYVIYNDNVPHSVDYSWKHGHTKGFLLWDKSQGFWLIHTIPQFPPFPEDGYSYPSTGGKNGQIGICITYNYSQFAEIDSQLLSCIPNVYSCSIPAIFHSELIYLPKMCTGSPLPRIPRQRLSRLQSTQGQNFLHFAKSPYFVVEIFVAWMAQQLQTNLLVETWQPKLPSDCSLSYHVYNIKRIRIPGQSTFNSHYDHSKWCVSQRYYKKHWTCIGDLNRSPFQTRRGGGFICTQNKYIYLAFRGLILHYQNCNLS